MERTLQVLNELERDGIMSRYAIGGAMGATFYVEPLLTFDLDIITSVRVLRAEHLAAICVQTGRLKDRERLRILREQVTLDGPYLSGILHRHHLEEKWNTWTA